MNFALNYGGRKEIEDCMRSIGKDIQSGALSPEDITTDLIDSRMLSGGLPDPICLYVQAEKCDLAISCYGSLLIVSCGLLMCIGLNLIRSICIRQLLNINAVHAVMVD